MKIGLVSLDHLRDWHGTTRLIDRIAAEMTARGHEAAIIAHEGLASSKVPVSRREYPHELITLDLTGPAGRRASREKIAAAGMDVCVASVGNNLIMHMPGLLRGSGIPFIFGDPHDPRVRTFAGWQPYESYGALACADAIQTLLPQYIAFYPQELRPRVVEIGVPAPPFAAVDFAARRSRATRTVIAVGRFNETMKRLSLLLRAFALLHKDFPDWRLKLVGDGPYWEYYHEMARQLGIKGRVDFTGAVPDPGVHYSDADIFCLPSLIEGFGLVYVEAAAYALPLAGYRFCVPSASFIGPDMGALADENTPESLAEALRELMKLPPEQREQTGLRARDALLTRYDSKLIFDKWEKLIIQTRDRVKQAGTTVLDKIWGDKMQTTGELKHIGPQWDGLGPDSPVWTKAVLEAAAAEISARDDPMKHPGHPNADAEAENIRLRCELARLKEDYDRLEKTHNTLLAQYRAAAGKRRK